MLFPPLAFQALPSDGVAFTAKVKGHEVAGRYLLALPEGYETDKRKKWPIVLFLHGVGERGNDLNVVRAHGPFKELAKGRKFPFILVAPQCPPDRLWETDMLTGLLDSAERAYRVDRKRESVTGLSMGGYGTWALAMATPERFAAIAPLCGGPRTEDAPPLRGATIGRVDIPPAEIGKIKGLPVYTVHGDADTAVPVQGTRDLVAALRAAGDKKVSYTEVPGAGHDVWTAEYAKDAIYDWLLSHRR